MIQGGCGKSERQTEEIVPAAHSIGSVVRRLSLHRHDMLHGLTACEVDPMPRSLVVSSDVRLDGSDSSTVGAAVQSSFVDCFQLCA